MKKRIKSTDRSKRFSCSNQSTTRNKIQLYVAVSRRCVYISRLPYLARVRVQALKNGARTSTIPHAMAESSSSDSSETQARRALEFAEQRFLSGDVAGARHCAAYALGLAPGLPAAEQALAAYDVHAAAAAPAPRGCGPILIARPNTTWYAVLGLPQPRPVRQPSADDDPDDVVTHDAVKRQHRRLCPDKNPSAAADGAFKLVEAAYDAPSAVHPPPPPPPAAGLRSSRDDEARLRFWQTAAQDDVAPPMAWPKQPPIARPPPRR